MTHPLEDCYDKLDRADDHLKSIKGEVQRFLETDPYSVVVNSYPGSMNKLHIIAAAKVHRETPRELRILIGEFFYNMRASLDQLAYILATPPSGGDPPKGTEFPIFKDRPRFFTTITKGKWKGYPAPGSGIYKFRGMGDKPKTIIKWLQPYRRINDPKGHPLWVIHDMGIGDRHRKAHVTGAILENQSFGINTMMDLDLAVHYWGMDIRSGPFVNGATVGQFTLTVTGPNPVMNVNTDFSYDVAFDPEGPARGAPVIPKLTELRDFVRKRVVSQLEKFV